MKQAARDYDLMLTFATRQGNYLADVDVAIKDAKGTSALEMKCDAPILLVDLPQAGTYRVQAKAGDYALNKTVRAKAKGHTNSLVLAWPREPAAMAGVAKSGRSQEMGTSGSSGTSGTSSGQESDKKDDALQQPRQ